MSLSAMDLGGFGLGLFYGVGGTRLLDGEAAQVSRKVI